MANASFSVRSRKWVRVQNHSVSRGVSFAAMDGEVVGDDPVVRLNLRSAGQQLVVEMSVEEARELASELDRLSRRR